MSAAPPPADPRAASVGSPQVRVDGRLKVTGAATYAADQVPAGCLYAVQVVSTVARGRVLSIDAAPVQARPGVRLVLTAANLPKLVRPANQLDTATKLGEARLPLSDDQVHYVGQVLAVVVADTLELAEAAARRIEVRYLSPEPTVTPTVTPVVTIEQAMPSAYAPPSFFGEPLAAQRGDPEGAFHLAAIKVQKTYRTPVEHHQPIEPLATVAEWQPDGALWLYEPTQWVAGARNVVAQVLGLPVDKVRVLSPFVGGGFGAKGFVWPHTLLCAVAARMLGRPVKLVVSRGEMASACGHRPETVQTVALGASAAGELRAILHSCLTHTSQVDEYVEMAGSPSRSLYRCDNVRVKHQLVRVDRPTPTPMRAPGEAPGLFALESAIDELAVELGMDPLRLRQLNHADTDLHQQKPYSSKQLRDCYRIGAERIGWSRRPLAPRTLKQGRWLVGLGMATAMFPGVRAGGAARVRLGIAKAGAPPVVVQSATQELGGGTYTILAQTVADALGVPLAQVAVQLGDSRLPQAPVSGGSMTTASVPPAVLAAVQAAARKLGELAVRDPQSPLYRRAVEDLEVLGGRVFLRGEPARGEAWAALLARQKLEAVEGEGRAEPGDELSRHSIHSFGAQFCEVHVDPELGRVRVARHVVVLDVGRVLNPLGARSQAVGGVVMGIGMALLEKTAYDERTGRPLSDGLGGYLIPTQADVGEIHASFLDVPDPIIGSQGARGVGEIALCGVAAAIANAIYHATGRRLRELPLTPEKLLV